MGSLGAIYMEALPVFVVGVRIGEWEGEDKE